MIVAVLGGRGFIGSALVRRLIGQGHSVRVFDQGPSAASSGHLQYFQGNFSEQESFREVIAGCDTVVHLISTTLPNTSAGNALADVRGNLLPTLRLLEQMAQEGIRRIVFPSSGGTVYGEARYLPIDEEHPTHPIVPYGATKLAIEKYMAIYRHAGTLDPVCLRISNPYGPGFRPDSPQGAIGAFLLKALRGEPIDIWGTGDIRRDYLFIDDLIDAMVVACQPDGPCGTINVATGQGTSLNDILRITRETTGRDLQVRYHERRSFDVQDNWLCNAKAQQTLGWAPMTPLSEGIRRTHDWAIEHI